MKKIPKLSKSELCFVTNKLDAQAVFQLMHPFIKENDVIVDGPIWDYGVTEPKLKGLIFTNPRVRQKDLAENTQLLTSFMLKNGFKQITNDDRDIETILKVVNS